MEVRGFDKEFLQEVKDIFDRTGCGSAAYDNIGYAFSDRFLEPLYDAYVNDPDGFMSLVSLSWYPDDERKE